ncbi:MAG: hypothetical protein JWM88_527 [Verrucomicrobia bacterium]|nr:hypothetical protein [Verrucomicrobiota bacterium]
MKKDHLKSPDLPGRTPPRADLDVIAARAYQLWEQEGSYHGRDREHWRQAEHELLKGSTTTVDKPVSQPAQQPPIEPVGQTVDLREQERSARKSA